LEQIAIDWIKRKQQVGVHQLPDVRTHMQTSKYRHASADQVTAAI